MDPLKTLYNWTSKSFAHDNTYTGIPRKSTLAVRSEISEQSPQPDSEFALVHEDVEVSNTDSCICPSDVEELRKRLREMQQKIERLNREKDELQEKYTLRGIRSQELKKKLKDVHDANYKRVKALHRRYHIYWGNRIRDINGRLEEANDKHIALGEENRTLKTQLLRSRAEQAESKRSHKLAEETVTKCEQKIMKLTETISRSEQRSDARMATKDDEYFATEFSELANAIQQWVFRHFRGAPDQRLETLDLLLQRSFEVAVHKNALLKTSRDHLDAISAIVAHQLTSFFFEEFGFLRAADLRDSFLSFFKRLEDTELQRQLWRAKTMNMIFKNSSVTKAFGEGVKAMAESLEQPFGDLAAKNSRKDQRNRALHGLIERAAKLAVEVAQQRSTFELRSIPPGRAFDPRAMEDTVGTDEDGKEGLNIGVVRVLLFPAILRRDYDQGGKLTRSTAIVLKAKVLTDFS